MKLGAPYRVLALPKKLLTICFTTSSKNRVDNLECKADLNSKLTEKSKIHDCGTSGRPGLNLHTVTRWLKSIPSVQIDLTKFGFTNVSDDVYFS